jgi:hypothetical protein
MRVLAASQADDMALEAVVAGGGHGLLTLALVRERLVKMRAAEARDALTLAGLSTYTDIRVPGLRAMFQAAEGDWVPTAVGTPVLGAPGGEVESLGEGGVSAASYLRKGAFQTPSSSITPGDVMPSWPGDIDSRLHGGAGLAISSPRRELFGILHPRLLASPYRYGRSHVAVPLVDLKSELIS